VYPLSVFELVEKETLAIDEILLGFELSNRQAKNAVFIEIIALIQSDGVYNEKEKDIIPLLTSKLDISNSMQNEVETWVQDMKSLYQKGNKLIQHD